MLAPGLWSAILGHVCDEHAAAAGLAAHLPGMVNGSTRNWIADGESGSTARAHERLIWIGSAPPDLRGLVTGERYRSVTVL
jgi:hypothetical protein